MVEYRVIIILDTESLANFSKEFMETLAEVGSSKAINFPIDIPVANLEVSQELSESIQNKITGYLSRKFNGVIIRGLRVKEIKLKLKEEGKDGS